MNNERRNIDILNKIVIYCQQIDEANDFFGNSFEVLKTKSPYKNAVSMCILQIGELVGHLTKDFKEAHSEMHWRDIKNMRNIAAHHYSKFDADTLWETITEDIPVLDITPGIF